MYAVEDKSATPASYPWEYGLPMASVLLWQVFPSVMVGPTQTSQSIHPVNIHRAAPTDPLPTAPSESQRRVHLVLNPDQRIQHHRPRLVQVERVALHLRLAGGLVGVPAVDVEGLGLRIGCWALADRGRLGGWFWRAGYRGDFRHGRDGFAFRVFDGRCHSTAEGEGREAPCC